MILADGYTVGKPWKFWKFGHDNGEKFLNHLTMTPERKPDGQKIVVIRRPLPLKSKRTTLSGYYLISEFIDHKKRLENG